MADFPITSAAATTNAFTVTSSTWVDNASYTPLPTAYYGTVFTAQTGNAFGSVVHGQPHGVERDAIDTARELLLAMLDPEQRDEYEDGKRFHVQTADGERTYRIEWGHAGNIRLIEDGKPTKRFCIHPQGFANEDAMLAQKLLIETDEAEFLRLANVSVA